MKKTISINLNGQIFNIEENGYEKLKSYLAALTKYFASYGDSKEILTDIEGRIAEKFDDYLRKDEKQAINLKNIDSLIAQMGTVADFEALKEDEDLAKDGETSGYKIPVAQDLPPVITSATNEGAKFEKSQTVDSSASPQKLYRDGQRKLIGGVCAGLAHYFKVDVIWIRLLFLGMFGFIPVLAGFSAAIIVIYFACWIAFPVKNDLAEDETVKKFFRDSDKKVLGGVVSGLAKYTGVDLGLLRLIFVLSIALIGTGIMVYVILWAITPYAKTITERMQMKGQAITIENIESNIKSAKTLSPTNESALASILLLPFRILGKFFSALTPLFSFSGSIIRVFAGLILMLVGVVGVFALVATLFSALGAFGNLPIGVIDNVPIHMLDAPKIMFLFAFAAMVVPFLILGMAGLSLLNRRNQFSSATWQLLGGVFLAGILGSTLSISKYASNFQRNNYTEKTSPITINTGTPTFDISDNEGWENYLEIRYDLNRTNEAGISFYQKYEANGKTKDVAAQNIGK